MSDPVVITAADLPAPDPDDWTNNLVAPQCPGECGNDCMHCHCYELGRAAGSQWHIDSMVSELTRMLSVCEYPEVRAFIPLLIERIQGDDQ